MPILQDFRQAKKISLPSVEGSELEIYDSVLVGDAIKIDMSSNDSVKMGIDLLPKYIKSWNFTDKDGKVLEINKDNIGLLKIDDVIYINDEIRKFALENKKK